MAKLPFSVAFPKAAQDTWNYIPRYPDKFVAQFDFPRENIVDFNTTENYRFPSTLDGDPVVATFRNFTINAGHVVTTTERCKGLYLKILGDLTIAGTLSMTCRGAKAPGKEIGVFKDAVFYCDSVNDISPCDRDTLLRIGASGGDGAVAINGACGRGGGRWGIGSSFAGGAGGGGEMHYSRDNAYGRYGESNGGAGGYGGNIRPYGTGGRGAGNNTDATSDITGCGGVVILLVYGDVRLIDGGFIISNGSNGLNWSKGGAASAWGTNGYGSGGGAIHLLYKGQFTGATSAVTANGGNSAGVGTVNISQF